MSYELDDFDECAATMWDEGSWELELTKVVLQRLAEEADEELGDTVVAGDDFAETCAAVVDSTLPRTDHVTEVEVVGSAIACVQRRYMGYCSMACQDGPIMDGLLQELGVVSEQAVAEPRRIA